MGRPKGSKNNDLEERRNRPCAKCGGPRKEYKPGRFECQPCNVKGAAKWAADNPERFADIRLDSRYRRTYGIDLNDVMAMLAAQHYVCAICRGGIRMWRLGDVPTKPEALCVDHDHATGKVRGLLCGRCNTVLGFVDDNPDILVSAIQYLRVSGR